MGRTVENLSDGRFTASALVYTVCVGVAGGMVVGSAKILWKVNLTILILASYSVAGTLTVFSSEDFTNIGWDSAGVTTGPVTVPFVLSLGIGFAKAVGAQEGFGILTCASVAPIITVLVADLLRSFYVSAVNFYLERRQASMISVGVQCPQDLFEQDLENKGELDFGSSIELELPADLKDVVDNQLMSGPSNGKGGTFRLAQLDQSLELAKPAAADDGNGGVAGPGA